MLGKRIEWFPKSEIIYEVRKPEGLKREIVRVMLRDERPLTSREIWDEIPGADFVAVSARLGDLRRKTVVRRIEEKQGKITVNRYVLTDFGYKFARHKLDEKLELLKSIRGRLKRALEKGWIPEEMTAGEIAEADF